MELSIFHVVRRLPPSNRLGRPCSPSACCCRPMPWRKPPAPATEALLTLPRDLSPWGMFMAADIVVKAVMVGLAFASVLTWTIWFAKAIELMRARRKCVRPSQH